ncbi:hypothetical protein HNQ93_003344 [Hymenobacter luteus]|uniref:Uncharacterized protein n=2 Tax=Hymenobacter TaxID=89966 RepID=A0A7W9WDE5_9BACT|nr:MULTISPECIES: hypothetical protein [Hymenobacter]MBB4602579.1 hypothetical protein [Hymenobacter latericoloratus]MBB6060470.1 hypothetical protein [Hymenobacter luteus]
MEEKFLFQVDKNFSLPGLGVLLLPASGVPELQELALHTALRVSLRYPTGPAETALATVEEIARTEMPLIRGLLLTQAGAASGPAGAQVWWTGAEVGWEELL